MQQAALYFPNLDYPVNLINSSINEFLHIDNLDTPKNANDYTPSIMIPLPFKNQQSANLVKRQMQNWSANIGVHIKPVFQSKKVDQEKKAPVVSNQCMV